LSQVQDPTEELYKQYHTNINSINNIFQFYSQKIAELKVQNQMLQKAIDDKDRKLKEHEPTKKAPNTK